MQNGQTERSKVSHDFIFFLFFFYFTLNGYGMMVWHCCLWNISITNVVKAYYIFVAMLENIQFISKIPTVQPFCSICFFFLLQFFSYFSFFISHWWDNLYFLLLFGKYRSMCNVNGYISVSIKSYFLFFFLFTNKSTNWFHSDIRFQPPTHPVAYANIIFAKRIHINADMVDAIYTYCIHIYYIYTRMIYMRISARFDWIEISIWWTIHSIKLR